MSTVFPGWIQGKIRSFFSYTRGNLSPQTSACNIFRAFTRSVAKEGIIPGPFSLEIHPHLPGGIRCINACLFCTGQAYDKGDDFTRGLPEETLAKLVFDVTHGDDGSRRKRIPVFTFAGNCTEPLLYPHLHRHMAALMRTADYVQLITNMVLGDVALFETFSDPAPRARREIRISLNAPTADVYDLIHRPKVAAIRRVLAERGVPLGSNERIFDRVVHNIELLAAKRRQSGLNPQKFPIYATFLLYSGNDNEREITEFYRWSQGYLDNVAFSVPQVPQMSSAPFQMLPPQRIGELNTFLSALKGREVKIDPPLAELKPKTFQGCWTRFTHAVIGYDGGLYPCTSVAAPPCSAFSEGNLNGSDFWPLWRNPERIERFRGFNPQSECDAAFAGTGYPTHVCTRTEFAFNYLLEMVHQKRWSSEALGGVRRNLKAWLRAHGDRG